jgi:alanyl-tRNA synthetase
VARRFRLLKQAAGLLKSSIEEVPARVGSLQDEVAGLKKELATLREQAALSTFNSLLYTVQTVSDVSLLAMEVPNADMETLRTLADKFREKYPTSGAAVLISGTSVLAVLTEDLVKRGLKAGDLITRLGGRGGGRPNMAQGNLSDGSKGKVALARAPQAIAELLK